jgi:hypothetical protein
MELLLRNPYQSLEMQRMSASKKRLLVLLVHVLCWIVFLSLPAIFNPLRHGYNIQGFVSDLLEPPRWTNGLLLIIVFYFNNHLAIPHLYFERKFGLLAMSFVASFGAFFLLNYLLMPPDIDFQSPGGFHWLGNSVNLFMFIIVYASSFALCLYYQWQSTKELMLKTEISFLKAQINPHFLFNTLNSIYALALTKSDNAPDAIVKLSGMMRYSVSEANQDYVLLFKEIAYISNYIDLQKLRLTDSVKIHYEVRGGSDDMQMAPFILIPFIENAFKHGVNSEEDSDIRIEIDIEENRLKMLVTNNKVPLRQNRETGAGIGVNTTRKRLEMLYPERHVLKIDDNKDSFFVSLQIDLK